MTKSIRQTSAIRAYVKPEHKRAAKVVGYALTLAEEAGYAEAAEILSAWLTEAERAALGFSVLKSLPAELAAETARAALGGAGAPLPPLDFDDVASDMGFWAGNASLAELRSVVHRAFEHLSPSDQERFLCWAGRHAK